MRNLTENEIETIVKRSKWATICTVTPKGEPYAIEATYFIDGSSLGFMINPRGTTMRNLSENAALVLKITVADDTLLSWAGVSLFGIGRNVADLDLVRKGWRRLEDVMKADYSLAAEKFTASGRPSPYLRCSVLRCSGRCSNAFKL